MNSLLRKVSVLPLAFLLIGAGTGNTTALSKTAAPIAVDLSSTTNLEVGGSGDKTAFARANHKHGITGILGILNGGTGASVLLCRAPGTNSPADNGQALTSNGTVLSCADLPVTGGLGTTGSAVPTTATYVGAKDSGGLDVGMKTCDFSQPFAFTALSGSKQVFAGSAGKKIYTCGFFWSADATATVKFIEGTGTDCATPVADVTGAAPFPPSGGAAMGLTPFAVPFTATTGTNLCVNVSGGTATGGGWLSLTQQ